MQTATEKKVAALSLLFLKFLFEICAFGTFEICAFGTKIF
jgi:hypothetical protein